MRKKVVLVGACVALGLATVTSPARAASYSFCKSSVVPSIATVGDLITIGRGYGQKSQKKSAESTLTNALARARSTFQSEIAAANAACTKNAKIATLVKKAGVRSARTAAARVTVQAKYDATLSKGIANRNEAIAVAFATWLSSTISANDAYTVAISWKSNGVLTARRSVCARVAAARSAYVESVTRANTQFDRDAETSLAALNGSLASARSASDRANAWNTYSRQIAAALARANGARASAAPQLSSEVSSARDEYEQTVNEIENEDSSNTSSLNTEVTEESAGQP